MKFKISKTEYNALPDDQKALYQVSGDDFVVKIEGMPDLDALQKTVTELTEKVATGEKEKADQKAAADAAAADAKQKLLDADRKKGDFTAIEEDYKGRIAKLEEAAKESQSKAVEHIKKLTIDSQVDALANKLAGGNAANAKLIKPFLAERMVLDGDIDSGFVVRVTKDGKPSAMNAVELEEEFRESADFKSVVAAPQSNGSGAQQQFHNPSEEPGNLDKSGADLSPRDRMASQAEQIASSIE